jgi:hypothetical protein
MARNNQRGSRNNNPSGRNQYSSDWMDTVRDRPMTSAAAAAAAVGAGVFLWSKRNQISDWSEERGWTGNSNEMAMAGGMDQSSETGSSRSGRSSSAKSRGGTSRSTRGQSRSSGQTMNAGTSGQGVTH